MQELQEKLWAASIRADNLEKLADQLAAALRVASIWAPHDHEPNMDSNGHCPMCNAQSALAAYEKAKKGR